MLGHQCETEQRCCCHSTCETCLCVSLGSSSWNCLFQEQVGCEIPARAYPETWKCRECFLFVSISYINILCCQQDWCKIPNPGFLYLKALQPWTHTRSFLQCRNCIIPHILNSSQETDPTLLEEEYIHYSWAQRYCFGWRPSWKCQLCYFNIWNVSQRITKVLNDIRFWTRTIVLARTYNVHPKFLNFLNYLLITV